MKAALIFGMTLVGLGVVTLAYFASPVRVLMLAYVPHKVHIAVPIAGGVFLVCGAGVLFWCRSRKPSLRSD